MLTTRKNKILGATVALALALALPFSSNAQSDWYIPRYITGDIGGGLHTIQFNPLNGKHKVGAGFRANAGCVFMFDYNWGLSTGLGLAKYASKAVYNNSMESVYAYDSTLNMLNPKISPNYEFRAYYSNFTEKQNLLQLEIPIMAYYQFPIITGKMNIVGRGGFRFGVPLLTKYKLVKGTIETRKYIPETGVELADTNGVLAHHGIFKKEMDGQKGKVKVNPVNLSLALEAGVDYKLTRSLTAYAGVYFGYCLTNIYKESLKSVTQPTNSNKLEYNSTLQSNQIDRASLLSAGVNVGIVWDYHAAYVRTKPKF